ncbi:DDB1- and CUL4-associated factor 6 [Podila epicladia]|nr:DDB1- and CUL4-associated factor 6 [Podila epicladia]KAG0095131.1 DDB1- and CUL4-associated factor 6 [Podila epicladia]
MNEPSRTRQLSDSGTTHASVLRRFSTLNTFPAARHPYLQHQVLAAACFVKRLEEQSPLTGHLGCVNTIAWDETGEYLVSGSDDRYLNIYRPMDTEPLVHRIRSGHRQNIFSAKFMSGSSASKIVSCSAEGTTILTDVNRFVEKSRLDDWMPNQAFNCHDDTTYEVLPDLVDSHIFYDCSDDGKINRYDTRIRTSCSCDDSNEPCDRHLFININSHLKIPSYHGLSVQDRILLSFRNRRHAFGVSAITQRPELPFYIAAACGDDTVRIYDSRKIDPKDDRKAQVYSFSPFIPHGGVSQNGDSIRSSVPERRHLETRITSLKYDPKGSGQLLVSYSRGDCYLISPTELVTRQEELQRPFGQRFKTVSGGDSSTSHYDNTDGDTDSSFNNRSDPKGKRRRASSDSQEESVKKTEKASPKDLPSVKAKPGQPALKKTVGTESEQNTQERHKEMRVRFDTTERNTRSKMKKARKGAKESEDSPHEPDSEGESMPGLESNTSDSMPELESGEGLSEQDTVKKDWTMEADWETTEDDSGEDEESFLRNILEDDTSNDDDDDEDDDGDLNLPWVFSSRRLNDAGSSASEDESRDKNREYWQRRSLRTAKQDMVQAYSGHRNARTMIKEANFFGPNSEFIMSGSDGGQIFFWDKITGKIVNIIKGDKNVVNCVQGHPVSSFMLAAAGIDKTTKIFMPTAQEPVKVSSLRGIKPPSTNTHVVRPRSSQEPLARPVDPDNELDPEHAYEAIVQSESSDADDDFFMDDDDDDDEDEDDDDRPFHTRAPPHMILQLLRHLASHRHIPTSENTTSGSSSSNSRTSGAGSRPGHDGSGSGGDEEDDGHEEENDDQTMSS